MRITILNGEPDPGSGFHGYVHDLAGRLAAARHQVTTLDLAQLDLRGCSGCWGCWVKTPGQCVKGDDSARVCQAAMDAELLLLASRVTMGFTSALLKRASDQMLPLFHPYLVIEQGEVRHRPRYARVPAIGLLLGAGPDADAEDLEITTAIWASMARHLRTRLAFNAVADRPAQEVADALAAVA
jgi:multimeric flavodoxin WrbA